jgi:alpha-ketoglutarate-dependent taurine dioxygenase
MLWRLQQWAAQPDFIYRHEWQVGGLLIWNNPGMMHKAVPYTDTRRVMHRTVIAGKEKPGRSAPAESMTKMLEPIR